MTQFSKASAHARVTALFALAASVAGGQAVAADAVRGKDLYNTNCRSCHILGAPSSAKNPGAISSAISSNRGGMGRLAGKLTSVDLADIAAYVANPNATAPAPAPAPAPTPAPAPAPAPTPAPAPAPTPAPAPAPTGDNLPTASARVAAPNGFGTATVHYPTSGGPYALVVVAPGFVESESAIKWWGPRLASSGFVVVTMGTKTLFDQPEVRAKQMMAALKQVVGLNGTGPFAGKIDASRQAVMGHSMGGGGALAAARDNPTLKAAIPLAPWHTTTNFSSITVPTFIIACQKDAIAPVSGHAQKFYDSLSATTPHAMMEIAGGDHFCVTNIANAANKTTEGDQAAAWLKYYVNGDASALPVIQTTSPASNVSRYLTSGF